MNRFGFIFLGFLHIFLFGCNETGNKDIENAGKYIQKIEGIRTYQFIRNYGMGGIYWTSNDSVVLDGVVKNKKGIFEQGVYRVSLSEEIERLAKIDSYIGFEYCFSGNVLHIKNDTKNIHVFNTNNPFEIKVGYSRLKKHKNESYSALRCKFVQWPTNDGYRALLENDGFLKVDLSGPKYSGRDKGQNGQLDPENRVVLADAEGREKKKLDLKIREVSQAQFLPDRNAYFGYRMQNNCASLWWLYREGWRVETQKVCFGAWAAESSALITSTKVGLFIEHRSSTKPGAYLYYRGRESKVVDELITSGIVSPDGCKVAYAAGPLKDYKDFPQVLKIFDACSYVKNKGVK